MANYSTVLAALALEDDEDTALILQKAQQQASATGLHVAHIEEHPVTGLGDLTGRNHPVNETQIKQRIFPKLQRATQSLGLSGDHLHITFGDPVQEINALALKLGCDLIVIGHHKISGWRGLLGTTASDLINGAKVDVLSVNTDDTSG